VVDTIQQAYIWEVKSSLTLLLRGEATKVVLNDFEYESIRKNYLPNTVRVLFVGESRPANGHFFYLADSPLVQYTRNAFSQVCPETPEQVDAFLYYFKMCGCYLDDLCHAPVNQLPNQERNARRTAGVHGLADRIRRYQPLAIITIMRAVLPYLEQALEMANLSVLPYYALPFPGQGHQMQYIEQLTGILQQLRVEGYWQC
jgi:hypothetical protein